MCATPASSNSIWPRGCASPSSTRRWYASKLAPWIDKNTKLRAAAANDFEKDLFKLMCNNVVFGKTIQNVRAQREHFDTSGYPKEHPLYSAANKKIAGRFKDETDGVPISEFVGLKSKMYCFTLADDAP
eukprot:jgi/Tetstr1/439823/TSEL_028234.t1